MPVGEDFIINAAKKNTTQTPAGVIHEYNLAGQNFSSLYIGATLGAPKFSDPAITKLHAQTHVGIYSATDYISLNVPAIKP